MRSESIWWGIPSGITEAIREISETNALAYGMVFFKNKKVPKLIKILILLIKNYKIASIKNSLN